MSYLSEVLADSPLAYWPLNEASGAPVDASPNGKTLTLVNAPTQASTTGPFRNQGSITLNGTNQRLDSNQGINHSKYTIEFWYKGTDDQGIVASSRGAGPTIAVRIGEVPVGSCPVGSVTVGVSGDGVWSGVYTNTVVVNDGKWHHVVCAWDGASGTGIVASQFTVYVDNVSAALAVSAYQSISAPVNSSTSNYMFGDNPSDNPRPLAGQLSNIALYGTALPATRVTAHYWASQRRVSGEAWAVSRAAISGSANTQVIVRGEPWASIAAQATAPIVVAGDPWISARTAVQGVDRVKRPVVGAPWAVGAGAGSGDAKSQVIVRGTSWQGSVGSADGVIEPTPDPLVIDFEDYPTDVYRYFVFDILTDEILAEVQMNDVSFSSKLGSVGDLNGTIYAINSQPDIDLYWATMPIKTALYVLRGEKAVWGGIIWNREYDAASKQVTISAGTWESYLFRRYIWHTFTTEKGTDQYDVVRKMLVRMRHDFAGSYDPQYDGNTTPQRDNAMVDIYINEAAFAGKEMHEITFLREEMKSFGEALSEFADNLNGFEWYFYYEYNKKAQRFRRRLQFIDTPPSLMKKGSPEPTDTEADKPGIDTYLFEYPGNIITVTLAEDGDNACTRQFVAGGAGAGVNLDGWRPIGSWDNEEYLSKGFPLVENVESSKHASTSKQTRLDRLAAVYGRESAPPIRRWSVTVNGSMDPIVGTYRLGHWCRLVINDEFIKQSLDVAGKKQEERGIVKRIVGITVNVPTGPQLPETVTLELEDDVVVSWEPADDENV